MPSRVGLGCSRRAIISPRQDRGLLTTLQPRLHHVFAQGRAHDVHPGRRRRFPGGAVGTTWACSSTVQRSECAARDGKGCPAILTETLTSPARGADRGPAFPAGAVAPQQRSTARRRRGARIGSAAASTGLRRPGAAGGSRSNFLQEEREARIRPRVHRRRRIRASRTRGRHNARRGLAASCGSRSWAQRIESARAS